MTQKVSLATDSVIDGNTSLTPKFATFSVGSGSTDTAIITAVASKKLRILSISMSPAGTATAFQFNSKPGGAGSLKFGPINMAANTPFPSGFNPLGFFETVAGEGLSATTGVGSTVTGNVTYVEV